MKVLIVDDDYISRTKIETIFEDLGTCLSVENGKTAIEEFLKALDEQSPFDLITLDLSMPEMNGTEVLEKIRQSESERNVSEAQSVKVIMVTAHADIESIMSCLQAGCTDYIVKPFNMKTVLKKLDDIGLGENGRAPVEKEKQPAPAEKKMNSLVVDDDMISRSKMVAILEEYGPAEEADSGQKALKKIRDGFANNTPFNLITLDISMPDMDGTEVLFNIRDLETEKKIPPENQVKILVVTASSDKDTYITCHQAGCNDYIVKPFDAKSISNKLKELEAKGHFEFSGDKISDAPYNLPTTSSIIQDVSTALQKNEISLPSLPETGIRFKRLVREGAGTPEIEELLKKDIGVSSKLIAISNTAFYKGMTKNETLQQAITRLGIETTQQIVEAITTRSLFSNTGKTYKTYVENLWRHSIDTAYAAEATAEILEIQSDANLFTLGLFHDIGNVILLQIIEELSTRERFESNPENKIIFETLSKYHGKFGATLLKRWEYSDIYIKVATYHNNIEAVQNPCNELLIVHYANQLVKLIEEKGPAAEYSHLSILKSSQSLGISTEISEKIAERIISSKDTEF